MKYSFSIYKLYQLYVLKYETSFYTFEATVSVKRNNVQVFNLTLVMTASSALMEKPTIHMPCVVIKNPIISFDLRSMTTRLS